MKSKTKIDLFVSESVINEDFDNNNNNFNYNQNLIQTAIDLKTRDQNMCEYEGCSKTFKTKYLLKSHQLRHSDKYLCDWFGCDYRAYSDYKLNKHKEKHLSGRKDSIHSLINHNIKQFKCGFKGLSDSHSPLNTS